MRNTGASLVSKAALLSECLLFTCSMHRQSRLELSMLTCGQQQPALVLTEGSTTLRAHGLNIHTHVPVEGAQGFLSDIYLQPQLVQARNGDHHHGVHV